MKMQNGQIDGEMISLKFKKIKWINLILMAVFAFCLSGDIVLADGVNREKDSFMDSVAQANTTVKVKYRVHVSKDGWTKSVSKGAAGTVGERRAIEALQLSVTGNKKVGIRYKAYSKAYGWQAWKHNGKTAGATGMSIPMEAVCIELTGKQAWKYDVYYRVHSQDFGWMDWAKNGEIAGSVGFSKRMEAIQIVVVKKKRKAPGGTARPNRMEQKIKYRGYVQSVGWQDVVCNGATAGTEGLGKRLEAFKASVSGNKNLGIQYSAHVQSIGWQDAVEDGKTAGTTGKSLRIEAVKFNLTGADAPCYNVWYRVHVQGYGWLGWARNGEVAGSIGQSRRVEAMQLRIFPKEVDAPGDTANALLEEMKGYIWPLSGYREISSPFGLRVAPAAGANSNHPGIDIPCPIGTPILAVAPGVVTLSRYDSLNGNLLIINHGAGMESIYAHNSSLTVSVGQSVTTGQVIAYSGNTGVSTGPHCHFGMRLNRTFVNPLLYLPN